MRLLIAACLLALMPGAAQAAWYRASSAHFVVYAEDSERDIRKFSQKLERYHAALAKVFAQNMATPSPSSRVTVFIVHSDSAVRQLYGKNSRNVGGFYIPRAGGSIAIIPQVENPGASGDELDYAMLPLLHEYAHHFTISARAWAVPRWMSEGGAEFFASASFAKDGGVGLGRPAVHRAGELAYARDVTATDLLDPEAYEKRNRGKGYDAFYGKSWLLYHYLIFEPARQGQLERYLLLLAQGKATRDAGLEAFGPFNVLERELDAYSHRPKIKMLRLPASMLEIGPVEVVQLSAGEGEMMPLRIRSNRGVDKEQAAEIVIAARAVAVRFPNDAGVLTALAEAEYDSGNDAAAIAAADKAITLDPARVNAYVQKGYALFRLAAAASDPEAGFKAARAPFVALNRIENDHPLPLLFYYESFARAGAKPPKLAVEGLVRAAELAPFDVGLRMTLAMQLLRDGRSEEAKRNLAPIAYNPHAGKLAEHAREVMAKIDADSKWDGRDFKPVAADEAED